MKKLNTLLNAPPNGLKPILFKISENNRITFFLKKQLPEFIALHFNQCITKGETLIILVDSPIWASHLRFYIPSLLEKVNHQTGSNFESIKIRVRPDSLITRPLPCEPRTVPSKATIELIRESTEHIKGEQLRKSLRRLSNTLNSLPQKSIIVEK